MLALVGALAIPILLAHASTDAPLAAAASTYSTLGLPMPPRDAVVVHWAGVGVDHIGNDADPSNILVAFVQPSWPRAKVWLGTGFYDYEAPRGLLGRATDRTFLVRTAAPGVPGRESLASNPSLGFCRGAYWQNVDFATALQLWIRNDRLAARVLFGQASAQPWGYGALDLRIGTNSTPLGLLAVSHWLDAYSRGALSAGRLQGALQKVLSLRLCDRSRELGSLLRGATKLLARKPNSTIRAIEDCRDLFEPRPLASGLIRRLASRGLNGLGVLLEDVDSEVPTRSTTDSLLGPRPLRVGEACRGLLKSFAAGALPIDAPKARYEQWLAAALRTGETSYIESTITQYEGREQTEALWLALRTRHRTEYERFRGSFLGSAQARSGRRSSILMAESER